MKRKLVLTLSLLLALAPGAWAQVAGGNVYGSVTDESGAVLPGASVSVSGATIGGRSTTSGSQGDFRFLSLDPGRYKVTVSLTGFSTVAREVAVSTGINVNVSFSLKVATVEETVTVTAETPIVDTKKFGTSTTLSAEELHKTPNSRDPWAILRTIPGVLVDRVNIAGNESGQQSNFQGKGAASADSMWNLDGVTITDMAAIGASPTYFDFDAFEEINVTTGGNDLKVATGGIGLNFVTKRGTNNFHGSLRGYFTHSDLQKSNISGTDLEGDARLKGNDKADHIDQIADYGFDVGGPIVKDKFWFWGSFGRQDIRLVRTNQTKDKTVLTDYNVKLNWQASSSDMVSVFYFNGEKTKKGRGVGFPVQETASFLWNQGGYYPGPGEYRGLIKVEENHVFSPSFVVNAKYAYYGTGFSLTPAGGRDQDGAVDFDKGIAIGSFLFYGSKRPQHAVNVDANYFATGMGGNHELKFGFGYRRTPVESTSAYSGSKIWAYKFTPSSGYAKVTRDAVRSYLTQYASGYFGDTFTKGRLTVNAGVRLDRQSGNNRPSSAEANTSFPDLLPALNYDGAGVGATWTDISPRAGLTYALDEGRKTVVRASYARYAGQISGSDVSFDNPSFSPSYLAYYWLDTNNDGFAQAGEVLTDLGVVYYAYVDPANPAALKSPNTIAADYKANHDSEFIVGIDRELAPNFAVSAAYTYRRGTDISWIPRIGMTTADWTANAPSTANGRTAQTFSPDAAKVAATAGGRILDNRPDYRRKYQGFELTLMKRLSNKWMARVAGSYMNWTEHFDSPAAIQDPTRTQTTPLVDGGQVVPRSAGSGKGDIFFSAKWQVTANALYQLPAGFEVSASVFGRQGYPRPIVLFLPSGLDGRKRALATPEVDDVRYADLWNVDVRLSKNLKLTDDVSLVLTADMFNVFNSAAELNRFRQANSSAFNRLDEVLSPQIFRFGVRLTF